MIKAEKNSEVLCQIKGAKSVFQFIRESSMSNASLEDAGAEVTLRAIHYVTESGLEYLDELIGYLKDSLPGFKDLMVGKSGGGRP